MSPAWVFLSNPASGLDESPKPAQIRNDDRMIADEVRGQGRPHVAGLAIAVQQHHRRT